MATDVLPPLVDVVEVSPLPGHRLHLLFEDGKRGVYDVTPLLGKGVFKALENPAVFSTVRVKYGTATWPGEIDIAPEELYANCTPA